MENCGRFVFYHNHVFFFLQKTKNKTTSTAWHVTSFPWLKLSKTITLDKSAREDSLSYCKNNLSGWGDLLHVTSPTWGPHLHLNGLLNSLKIKCYFRKILLNPCGFKSSLRIHAWLEECVIQQIITCWVQHIFVVDSLAFVGRKLYFNSLSPGNQ